MNKQSWQTPGLVSLASAADAENGIINFVTESDIKIFSTNPKGCGTNPSWCV